MKGHKMSRCVIITERFAASRQVGERIKVYDNDGSMWVKCGPETTMAMAANVLAEDRRVRGYWMQVELPKTDKVAWVSVPATMCTGKENVDWFWN
jgi:hypothetical protein